MAQLYLTPVFWMLGALAYYQIEVFGWMMFLWLLVLVKRNT